MADILILSERDEAIMPLVAGLEDGGHRVGIAGLADPPGNGPDPDVLVVDAVKDLAAGRDACRAARAHGTARVIALVDAALLDAVGPDWDVDTFLLDGCSASEALARIRIALGPTVPESAAVTRVGDLVIDPETYQVRLRGRPLDLTYKEFQLLSFLAQRPGRVFSRSHLLQEVWGYDFFGGTRTVDVHVRRLRAKLGAEHESMIATVRNVGYKMEPPPRSRG